MPLVPMKAPYAIIIFALTFGGCFYPPQQKPIPSSGTQITLALPYDLAWDAAHAVIAQNGYRIITEDPDNGIVEAQAVGGFTTNDADCGKLKGIAGKYQAEPDLDSSAVYDFHVRPEGNEASTVSIRAAFTSPLHVPLHPMGDVQCISRGTQEKRLIKEIALQAHNEHRPEFKPDLRSPSASSPPRGGLGKDATEP
jgi:hypothetical protein